MAEFGCLIRIYKKLETRDRKQEGEAPGAPILACIVGVFSFIIRCGLAAHVGYKKGNHLIS